MSAIHYKFSSSNEYKNVTFDGLNLSLHDLKKLIMEKQKLKSTELDLHITNAQTLQVYKDESILIPKNTAVLVRRIPLGPIRDSKVYIVKRNETAISTASVATKIYQENDSTPKLSFEELKKTSNLAEANASEEDKIKAAIAQSTNEYDPSNFVKPPRYGSYKYSAASTMPSSQVRCYRCGQHGHYSSQCPMPKVDTPKQHHHATGIPRSHMVEVNKDSKGAMLTADGRYVVPNVDKKGYDVGKKERPPFLPASAPTQDDDEEEPIPDELICLLCKDLLVDAVVIPCCGNSYCDECIRNALLESEHHQCPTCKRSNISPDSLIANKFLRQAVNKFRNDTGIVKKRSNAPVWPRPAPSEVSKAVQVQPSKITYGPPRSTPILDHSLILNNAYKVKASADQVIASKPAYTVSRRTPDAGGGSPRDPNQPIRIKIGKPDKPDLTSSSQSTPSEAKLQSTLADTSLQSSSTTSDSYTFNSTPESNEQKPKTTVAEPLPPGISPPTAKVVRPLVDQSSSQTELQDSFKLSGIQPLADTPTITEDKSTEITESISAPAEPETTESKDEAEEKNVQENVSIENSVEPLPVPPTEAMREELAPPGVSPAAQPLPNPEVLPPGVEPQNDESQQSQPELEVSEISSSDVDMTSLQALPIPDATAAHLAPVHSSAPPSVMSTIPPPRISVPPPSVPIPIQQPPRVTAPPPALPRHLIPGLLPGMPPIPVSGAGASMFQHPPPPFPPIFPPLPIRPGQFNQPPPGFPAAIPPPSVAAMAIPSLAKSAGTAALPPPPGVDTAPISTIPTINNAPTDNRTSRHGHHSPHKTERSPRKRVDRRGNKSKLDIMSDEFAENLKKRPERRHRGRSRSRSYSSSSSSSSSSSYSRSSSSYSSSRSSSSYSSSATSWSNSSYSRSPSPRKKRRSKRSKRRSSKTRRKRSSSWSGRSNSRDKSRGSKRKEGRKKRDKSPPKRKKRDNRSRSHTPRRKFNRDPQRTPPRPRRTPSPRSKHVEAPQSHPQIPVISRPPGRIPGLPSIEEADFERDQALYAHFRHAYERDWYERGIRPPPPYDRFIQARISKSPSPPPGISSGPPPGQVTFPPGYPHPPIMQGHSQLPGPPPPSLMDIRVAPARAQVLLPPGISSQPPPQHPPHWEDQRYPSHSRSDHSQRDYHHQPGRPGYSDYSSRNRHDDYDSKEERYRMQLSPRSRRRYDMDHPSRESRYRDGRYGGHPRRPYDDYQARKRAREAQRDASPRESQYRSKRSRPTPEAQEEEDGDATPVWDERPPPEERHLEKERPATTRIAGDVSKIGKKPRRDKKVDSDHARSRRSSSPGKRDSKSRSSRTDAKTSKRKAESRDSSSKSKSELKSRKTDSKRSKTPDKKSRKEESKSDKKESKSDKKEIKSDKKEAKSDKRRRRDHSKTKDEPKSSTKVESEDKIPEKSNDNATEENTPKDEKTEKTAAEIQDQTAKISEPEIKSKENESPVTDAKPGLLPEVTEDSSTESKEEKAPSKQENVDSNVTTEIAAKPKQTEKENSTTGKSKKKEKTKIKLQRKGPGTDQSKKESTKTSKIKKSEAKDSGSKPAADKTKAKKDSAEDMKLVEYDGTGPPPKGDELVKITIPKSKWEESDEEGKSEATAEQKTKNTLPHARRVVKTSEVKPTKGRRIRIKRKSPAPPPKEETSRKVQSNVEAPSETPKSVVHSAVKKLGPPAKEPISDARMVITLRRNSKNQENRRRRVSMGNPDEAPFEPDYDDMSSPEQASERAGRPKSVGVFRNERQSRDEDPDALAISDYSSFSSEEQEKTKKKKKKKKHKHKSQISDVTEEESRKKRSYDESEADASADERKHHRRRDGDDHKRHRKNSPGAEKAKKKKKRRESAREKDRYHERDSQSRERNEKSREKKRKKEKKQKHRHRRESQSYECDLEVS